MENNDMVSLIDQLGVTVENLGNVAVALYKRFIDGGLPPELAADLVNIWWKFYWENLGKAFIGNKE